MTKIKLKPGIAARVDDKLKSQEKIAVTLSVRGDVWERFGKVVDAKGLKRSSVVEELVAAYLESLRTGRR